MHGAKGCKITATLLTAAFVFAGCSKTDTIETSDIEVTDVAVITDIQETTEITETTQEFVPFEFNPHAYSSILEACYSDDYRDSFDPDSNIIYYVRSYFGQADEKFRYE